MDWAGCAQFLAAGVGAAVGDLATGLLVVVRVAVRAAGLAAGLARGNAVPALPCPPVRGRRSLRSVRDTGRGTGVRVRSKVPAARIKALDLSASVLTL